MQRFTRNSDTISGKLEEELVMMDVDKGMYFSLNPIATRIWEMLEKSLTVDELVALLMEEYEIDQAQCTADVEEYLKEMEKLGLILHISE